MSTHAGWIILRHTQTAETVHFLEAVAFDRPVLVTPEHARMVMEVYMAADVSAEKNEPVALQISGAR